MARLLNKLTVRTSEGLTQAGRYSDGGGLYLSVTKTGARKWVFMYRWEGAQREMGLGSAAKGQVSLARAREIADSARSLLNAGQDPLEVKHSAAREVALVPTFGELADGYTEAMRPSWRNAKHAAQWTMTLTEYAGPIRSMPVDKVTTADVLKVLKPLWHSKPETAGRLRGRIENVLDAAKAKGHWSGENPARWRGHLDQLLPRRQKLSRGHHAALNYDLMKEFTRLLRERESIAALALEFTILTAARSGEALNATWREFDLKKGVWTVPKERMKAKEEHQVPLVPRAVAILARVRPFMNSEEGYVFPGQKQGVPLSNMAMSAVLKRMGYGHVTVHGFRSSFRDWAGDRTSFSHETCEQALAHSIASKTEAAYRRSKQFEKRCKLMVAWAAFCEPGSPPASGRREQRARSTQLPGN